jgi:hypothetical protein
VSPRGLRWAGRQLTFFSTLAIFGTALDITLAELLIEPFDPADEATRPSAQCRLIEHEPTGVIAADHIDNHDERQESG